MARSTNGSGQYGESSSISYSATNTVSMMAWVNPATLTGDTAVLVSRSGSFYGIVMGTASGNPVTCSWQAIGFDQATGLFVTLNKWNFVAGVVSPTNIKTYHSVQGGSLGSFTQTASNAVAAPNIWDFSRDPAGNLQLNGSIAEVAIWNASLTADELNALFLGVSPRCVRPGSLIGYWPLFGLSGSTTEPDLSGRGANMTLTGSPPYATHAPVTPFTRKARAEVEAAAAPSSVIYRRTLSGLGGRVGTRQQTCGWGGL